MLQNLCEKLSAAKAGSFCCFSEQPFLYHSCLSTGFFHPGCFHVRFWTGAPCQPQQKGQTPIALRNKMKKLCVSEELGNYESRPNLSSLAAYFSSSSSLVTLIYMEVWWLASPSESPDLEPVVSGLVDGLYCSVCQHVGVGMGIIPS